MKKKTRIKTVKIELANRIIRVVRDQRVIVDSDLAAVYGVSTKRLNEAVKRNASRFPEDFSFVVNSKELTILRSQIATSSSHGGRRYLPRVFTEHGVVMAANLLDSPHAVQMSVFVVRAFVKMREALQQNRDLARKLTELERRLTERLDMHETALSCVLDEIRKLMEPAQTYPKPGRAEIGFHVHDAPAPARSRRKPVQPVKY